jgi:subtilase family serine protease
MNGDNLHNEMLNLSLEVIETLDVGSIFTSFPSSVKKGRSTRINLEVFNAKTESITGVIITPITDAVIIPSEYFIGAMDADDVFATSFDLYTNTLDYGNHTIGFKIVFKQGSEYHETPIVSHTFLVVAGEGSSYQPSSGGGQSISANPGAGIFEICLMGIVIIIIVIAVFILWRWKRRRNIE